MTGGKYYEFFDIKNEKMEKMADNMCEAANAFGFLRKERDELQKELKRNREAVEHYQFELKMIDAETGHKDKYPEAKEYIEYFSERAKEALKKGEAILSPTPKVLKE